jgi:hypothetical protein
LAQPAAAVCIFDDVPDGMIEFCRTELVVVFGTAEHVTGDCSLRLGGTIHARPMWTATNRGDPDGNGCPGTEEDVGLLALCVQGPCSQAGPCMCGLDFDGDMDVDLADVAAFQRARGNP